MMVVVMPDGDDDGGVGGDNDDDMIRLDICLVLMQWKMIIIIIQFQTGPTKEKADTPPSTPKLASNEKKIRIVSDTGRSVRFFILATLLSTTASPKPETNHTEDSRVLRDSFLMLSSRSRSLCVSEGSNPLGLCVWNMCIVVHHQ